MWKKQDFSLRFAKILRKLFEADIYGLEVALTKKLLVSFQKSSEMEITFLMLPSDFQSGNLLPYK